MNFLNFEPCHDFLLGEKVGLLKTNIVCLDLYIDIMSKGHFGDSLLNEETAKEFLSLSNKNELQERIEIMTVVQLEQFWLVLDNLSTNQISFIDRCAQQMDQGQSVDSEMSCLLKIVACAESTMKLESKSLLPNLEKCISKIAVLLLYPNNLASNFKEIKITIARFIESWWSSNNAAAINSIVYLIPFLLIECLKPGVKAADFKRLWNIRGGFLLLDYQNESTFLIRELIMDALICPAFVNSPVGEKLLVYFLTLDKGITIYCRYRCVNLCCFYC